MLVSRSYGITPDNGDILVIRIGSDGKSCCMTSETPIYGGGNKSPVMECKTKVVTLEIDPHQNPIYQYDPLPICPVPLEPQDTRVFGTSISVNDGNEMLSIYPIRPQVNSKSN